MTNATAIGRFRDRIETELLPTFCNDAARRFDTAGFARPSITISDFDAKHFLSAIDAGLVWDIGGGRYRAPRSEANEQLFWEGAKAAIPRPLTLWLEPVMTIGAVARLHFDYGWPAEDLGMQSKGYAFDLMAYDGDHVVIAGEVKKSKREIHQLLAHFEEFSRSTPDPQLSTEDKRFNSAQKWRALLANQIPIFWAIGPDGYTHALQMEYGADGSARCNASSNEALLHSHAAR
jgi:hypothetical protein